MPLRLRVIPPASRSHETGRTPATGERSVDFGDEIGQIRIGRRPDLELSLPFAPLSGVHARLVRSDEKTEWLLEDLGSTNGTFVGGERLKPGVKHPILAGTVIKLAEVKVIFDGEMRGFERTEVLKEVRGTPLQGMPVVRAPAPGKAPGTDPSEGATPVTGTPVKGASPKGAPLNGTPVAGTPVGAADAKAAELRPAELRAAEVRAAEHRVAEMRAAEMKAEMRAVELRAAEAKADAKVAEAKAAEAKVVDPTETFVRRPARDLPAPAAASVPFLSAVEGIKDGVKVFRLEQRDHVYMFGRTRRCEFRVQISEVSREHASFTRRSDGIYVSDLGSVNGVLVNNTRVSDFRLYDGDLIQLGHIKLRLFDPTETGKRGSDSAAHTSSRLAPHELGAPPPAEAPPAERSVTFQAELDPDYHPAIAGALAAENHSRPRRQSVRIMFTQGWEGSSKFRYAVVIVVAAALAVGAVVVGMSLFD